jgi:tetratricopeptide (TPR) repeat protein
MTKKDADSRTTGKPATATAKPLTRTTTEQTLRDLQNAVEGKNFANAAEANAFLQTILGAGLMESLLGDGPDSLKDEAQELAFDAMEADSDAQAMKLAKRALRKDPDCVDALVVLAEIESDSPRKLIVALQHAVTAGERSLGAKFIAENKGHFWSIIETRPYMRALAQLAGLLRSQGIHLDAIRHYENMLALNPNDNQGVRDPLLGLYLATDNMKNAQKLLQIYKNDSSANFAWGRVLERFLSDDLPGASTALSKARKANRFVELYLSGKKGPPKHLPEMYSMGSEEEAILCVDNLVVAWADHENAVSWLHDQIKPATARKKKTHVTRTNKKQNNEKL